MLSKLGWRYTANQREKIAQRLDRCTLGSWCVAPMHCNHYSLGTSTLQCRYLQFQNKFATTDVFCFYSLHSSLVDVFKERSSLESSQRVLLLLLLQSHPSLFLGPEPHFEARLGLPTPKCWVCNVEMLKFTESVSHVIFGHILGNNVNI